MIYLRGFAKCYLRSSSHQGWRQEFSDEGVDSSNRGLTYGFQGTITTKNIGKYGFHLPTGAIAPYPSPGAILGSHGKRNRSVPSSFLFLERMNRLFTREWNDCVPILVCVQTGTQSFRLKSARQNELCEV